MQVQTQTEERISSSLKGLCKLGRCAGKVFSTDKDRGPRETKPEVRGFWRIIKKMPDKIVNRDSTEQCSICLGGVVREPWC